MLRVVNLLSLRFRQRGIAVLLFVTQCPRLSSLSKFHQKATVRKTEPKALFESTLKIATNFEFLGDPAATDLLLVALDLSVFKISILRRIEDGLSRKHACFHRVVASFDLSYVQEPC
jgi:hypothetical protein